MYLEFFGFADRPFTLVPDPGLLYWSAQHKRAYAVLDFGILSSAPVTLITGEIGAGKTTLVQTLLQNIDDTMRVGLVSNAQGDRGELLQWVLHAFDVPFEASASYVQLYQQFEAFLLAEYAAGRRVVLIFDEAQNLSLDGLEELRMLTNINSNKDVLIQLILVGQPELRAMVRAPRMQQLAQRISASFHLDNMDAGAVAAYISHRLQAVGGTGAEFSAEAADRIHRATRGVPRLVNQLCEFALLYAWGRESKEIGLETIEEVLNEGVFFGGANPAEEQVVLVDPVNRNAEETNRINRDRPQATSVDRDSRETGGA